MKRKVWDDIDGARRACIPSRDAERLIIAIVRRALPSNITEVKDGKREKGEERKGGTGRVEIKRTRRE